MKTKGHVLLTALLVLSLCVAFSCKPGDNGSETPEPVAYNYQVPDQTGDGWQTASLSDVGLDETRLTDLGYALLNGRYNEVHSVLIIKDGLLVFEEYFAGHDFGIGTHWHGAYINFDRDTPHNTHSATKSFTSACAGIAVDLGFINSVNDGIFDYFTQYAHLNTGNKGNITVEHLLTMTSGLEWNEWDATYRDSYHDLVVFNQSSDPIGYLLSKPLVTEPGTSFYYNGAAVDALGEVVRLASGQALDEFSDQYLFAPLGISNYQWQVLNNNIICGHGDIYIRPRDMAKFGQLFLNKGQWNGTRIISEDWVNRSIAEYIPLPQVNWAEGYGYLWWRHSFNVNGARLETFGAEGWGGQNISVFPDQNLVVIFTGANYETPVPNDEILQQYILPALF